MDIFFSPSGTPFAFYGLSMTCLSSQKENVKNLIKKKAELSTFADVFLLFVYLLWGLVLFGMTVTSATMGCESAGQNTFHAYLPPIHSSSHPIPNLTALLDTSQLSLQLMNEMLFLLNDVARMSCYT